MHTTREDPAYSDTIPRDAMRSLQRLQPARWVRDCLVDWAVIIGTFVAYGHTHSWLSYLTLPLCVLIVGSRQHAMGLLGHDAAHRLAFRNRRVNTAVPEVLIGWPLFIILETGYRPWHFNHHRNLGSGDDSELDSRYRGVEPYVGRASWAKVSRCFLFDLIGLGMFDLFNFIRILLPYSHPYWVLGPVVMWGGAAILLGYMHSLWILGIWALSEATAFWAVFRIRAWTEHVDAPADGHKSSHRFAAGPLARFLFFPHHTYCHYEHHRWPQVPYYNLPKLRALDHSRPVLRLLELFPLR
jgi:fatty acid desaturase